MGVVFIRTVIVFIILALSLRIMGKRQLGELEPIELVVAILISNLAAQPLQELGTPLLYGIVPVLTLLSCQVLISGLTLKSASLRAIVSGKPSILIKNGVIDQREMRRNRITLDELSVELRQSGITDISTVKYAILETSGKLSILPYAAETTVTLKDMGVSADEKGLPISVICDGRIIRENLPVLGIDENWLRKELTRRNIMSASEVYLMSVDEMKNIYLLKTERGK